MNASHQILARCVSIALDLAAHAGLDPDAICEGLPFDPRTVRKLSRVSWDDYCVCVERIEEMAGGPEAVRALTRAHYYEGGIPEFRALSGLFISPIRLLRLLYEVIDPIAFPIGTYRVYDHGESRFLIETQLNPGVRPCEAWMRGGIGACEAVSVTLGLPASKVLRCTVTGTYSSVLLEVPTPVPRGKAVKQLGDLVLARVLRRTVLGFTESEQPIVVTITAPVSDELSAHVALAAHQWKLTDRQSEVLRSLSSGKSNKEIANELGCAENTVELHVTNILARSAASSRSVLIAKVWSEF